MSTKHVPSRKEVDPQRTWNDISVFATVDDWSAEVAKLAAELPELRQWQGRLAEGPSVLADALQAMNEYYQRFGKALVYAYMSEAVDTGDQAATARAGQVFSLFGQVRGATAFLDPELLAIGRERLTEWMAVEPRLKIYDHYVDDLFRQQAHVRSPEVEELLGLVGDAFQGPSSTYSKLTNSDFKFQPIVVAGEEVAITQGTIDDFLNSPDREVRRTAWENYHDQFLAYKNTLAGNLTTAIKQDVFNMRARRYDTSLDAAMFRNNIPVEVFHNLLDTFKRNRSVWHRYWDVRRRALGIDAVHTYDVWAPLMKDKPVVPYEQAVDWIATALSPLGEDYAAQIRRGSLEQRWVDVYPNQGKAAGAFSGGSQGTYPFIMMSYTDDAGSMGTLAHELGHSMHSFLTWENQPHVYADYTLFAAEVASNFHQAMLRGYLLGQDIDSQLKIAVLEEAMSNFHRYFLIMPTLAMFEWEMHKRVEAGKGLTADDMIAYLADLFAESYGDAAAVDRERDGIRWATFSHMYMNYYVYSYATGISGANALARRVLSGQAGAAEDYLGFLKAGGSRYPIDALRSAGVDLTRPEPVETAFEVLSGYIDQLDGLVNG